MCKSQSGTAFQAGGGVAVTVRGHPLLRRVCTSVTHGVAFQAILDFCDLNSSLLTLHFSLSKVA